MVLLHDSECFIYKATNNFFCFVFVMFLYVCVLCVCSYFVYMFLLLKLVNKLANGIYERHAMTRYMCYNNSFSSRLINLFFFTEGVPVYQGE